MHVLPDTVALRKSTYANAGAGNTATVTLNAVADEYHVLDKIHISQNTAAAATLRIENNTLAATLCVINLSDTGPFTLDFGPDGLETPINSKVIITLSGATSTKALTVQYR